MIASVSTRDYRLDSIKTIMILGIVVEHSIIIYGYPRNHELVWGLLISWLMPLFTFISGYLFKERKLKDLLLKYLYPMFLFSAVNFAIGYLFYDNYHEGINLIGYAMWYLWALFWFQIITPPLLKLFNNQVRILMLVSLFVVMLYISLPRPVIIAMIGNKLQVNRIVGFYPFYLLGIAMKNNGWLKTKNYNNWRIITVATLVMYLVLCYFINGFAYKSSFYLSPSTPNSVILQILLSYAFIMALCVSIIQSLPNREFSFTKYGGYTLNVYLLHMIVVFPICYGFFMRLEYNMSNIILNSVIACLLCLVFFSKKCDTIMKSILLKPRWSVVVVLYMLSLMLVNHSVVNRIFE